MASSICQAVREFGIRSIFSRFATTQLMRMNLPNLLTLSRVPILFVIVGLLYMEWQGAATLAFLLFVLSGLTDWLDGYLTRRLNLVSNFGKFMDALTDKIILVGMFIALLATQLLPPWAIALVLLIVCREFFITGLRLVAASHGMVLAAEKSGKQKTLTQIISIGTLLLVPVLQKDLSFWTEWKLLAPFSEFVYKAGLATFLLASVLTVVSGARYLNKYWSVLFRIQQ